MTVEAWQLRGPEQAAKRAFSNHPQEAERTDSQMRVGIPQARLQGCPSPCTGYFDKQEG